MAKKRKPRRSSPASAQHAPPTTTPSTPTTFPNSPKLPTELKSLIWKHFISQTTVVDVTASLRLDSLEFKRFRPPSFFVSKESRALSLHLLKINAVNWPNSDTIYYIRNFHDLYPSNVPSYIKNRRRDLNWRVPYGIKHLAIDSLGKNKDDYYIVGCVLEIIGLFVPRWTYFIPNSQGIWNLRVYSDGIRPCD